MNEITILFTKQNKLWIRDCKIDNSNPIPVKLICLLAQGGFILSEKFQGLISKDCEDRLINTLEPYLKETRGLGRRWKTVWITNSGLPEQETQNLIQAGLYSNPELLKEIRDSQKDAPDFWEVNGWNPETILEPGFDSDISDIFENLLSSPLPLNKEDLDIVGWVIENRVDLVRIPSKIPIKETLSIVLSYGYGEDCISGVTDILRVASYLSENSSILDKKTRIKLSRGDRKFVLGLLERYIGKKGLRYCVQDAKKYKELWKILCRVCHPIPDKYPNSYAFFGEIQSNSEIMRRGWNSKLQKAYDDKDYKEVLKLLSQRPSEFLRRYDSLFRKALQENDFSRIDDLQSAFIGIQGVPGKVLFELYRYYDKRGEEIQRSFLDKHGIRRLYSSIPALQKDSIDLAQTIIMESIRSVWKTKSTFKDKKVYLDLEDGINFSLSLRNGVIDKTEPMYPGQKVSFPTSGIIRFFLQWIDPNGTEDLDLHAWLISDSLESIKSISWSSGFQDKNKFVSHSGDIRHQIGDCAEYVTIDYSKEIPYTWMLVTVQNFDGPKLCNVENWIGVSKITEKTSETLFRGRVTSESRDMAAFIVNIKEGWARLILEGVGSNVLEDEELIRQYITPDTLDVKSLLSQYIKCTGGEVSEEKSEEDVIIIGENDLISGKIHEYLLG